MATALLVTPLPAREVRLSLSAEQWKSYVKTWLDVLNEYLFLSTDQFKVLSNARHDLIEFLVSYVHENAHWKQSLEADDVELRHVCFRLIHRCLNSQVASQDLLYFSFLSDLCLAYSRATILRSVLGALWTKMGLHASPTMTDNRQEILQLKGREMISGPDGRLLLRRIAAMIRLCPQYGQFLMSGNDILDWLMRSWSELLQAEQNTIIKITYLGLKCLLDDQATNISLLLDHLYSVKESANKKGSTEYTFLTDLCSQTPIVQVLESHLPNNAKPRARTILSYMRSLRLPKEQPRRQRSIKAQDQLVSIPTTFENREQMVRQAAVQQICEMFPGVGASNADKLLIRYSDNVEGVISALLDGTITEDGNMRVSPQQKDYMRIDLPASEFQTPKQYVGEYAPRKFADSLEQDDLATTHMRQIHSGRREERIADTDVLDKAKIYSALAAFDLDDDEHDDTYDVQDVGGTVDVQGYDKDREDSENGSQTELLYRAWKSSPSSFDRHKNARQTSARLTLKQQTGMTDEMIEGFAIMLSRDRAKMRRLEAKYPDFTGEQTLVGQSSWTHGQNLDTDIDEGFIEGDEIDNKTRIVDRRDTSFSANNHFTAATPTNNQDSRKTRQRKTENKASRANHNRKAGRARKLAKVGAPG